METKTKGKKLQTVQRLFLYFMMAAVIGWCYEVFLEVVVYHWGFHNRGVLFGPYCPVYGVGMLAFLICFGKFVQMPMRWSVRWMRPILIFLGCGAVATGIELIASYLLEWITGSWRGISRPELHFLRQCGLESAVSCFCICCGRCLLKSQAGCRKKCWHG